MKYDKSLLSCLVDRWRPETHTFHFPWGEMAPTLQDVSFLLGLPLAGAAIGPFDAPVGWREAMRGRFAHAFAGVEFAVPFKGENDGDKHGPELAFLQQFEVRSVLLLYSY